MGGRGKGRDDQVDFDIALWGYDRRQVDRYIDDLTAQLAEAWSQLDTMDVLQAHLAQAHAQIGELRLTATAPPGFAERLSEIMHAAEQLWRQAADAGGGDHPDRPVGAAPPHGVTPPTE